MNLRNDPAHLIFSLSVAVSTTALSSSFVFLFFVCFDIADTDDSCWGVAVEGIAKEGYCDTGAGEAATLFVVDPPNVNPENTLDGVELFVVNLVTPGDDDNLFAYIQV
tara:strand:- start:21 stop:344 length:324 start_codon:yes stop_codon:yes gene_type:complete